MYNQRMEQNMITEYFEEVETTKEYDGYFCSVAQAITLVLLGSICGLKNVSQIHQWAVNPRISRFLKEYFGIKHVPCYYWLLCLLKLIAPDSLRQCFTKWVTSLLPEDWSGQTLSIDGKSIRSTKRMSRCESPLHIVSAQLSEWGMTFAQRSVDEKSNEIPAVQELLNELELNGCMVVADALNCQKETAESILKKEGDYLLCAKDNQATLKQEIEEYVQDPELRKTMETVRKVEKNRGRMETRTAFVTGDIGWMSVREEWKQLSCIGAIHTEFERKSQKTEEWHYYICSRKLSAEELLHHARMEWSVETMHWLLDVHFSEDSCRVENREVQEQLNVFRKMALNLIKRYKEKEKSKRPISKIMLDCLLDPLLLASVFSET